MVSLPAMPELERLFAQKYGSPSTTGPQPRRRHAYGYYLPSDIYEALVSRLVTEDCAWIDVGGGRNVFPENAALARSLASRCAQMVAVDPSPNVHQNVFAHERVQCAIEHYRSDSKFDLATLRMVAEHIERPHDVVRALHALLRPTGKVVILTVNLWSPITIASRVTPIGMHHPIKSRIWGGSEEDTFPVCYLLNTRSTLRGLFEQNGFREAAFARLDDLTAFGRFQLLNIAELVAWKALHRLGIAYPETCLLGVYERC